METLKKNFTHSKRVNFTISISDLCPKEPLNLRSEQDTEFNRVTILDGMMERRNGGISYNSACFVVSLTKMEFQRNKKISYN